MEFELEEYLPYLDGLDIPLSDKEEMLRTTWKFMEAQVDIAFGLGSVQLAKNTKES